MAQTVYTPTTWPELLERHLLCGVLRVDPARVRMPRSLEVGLVWEKGRIRGTVEVPGGRFLVTLRLRPLTDRAWKWAVERLAKRPEAYQAILAGRLDPSVIDVLVEAGANPFVSATKRVECTCKGEADCRHRLAVAAQMVAETTENPFLWFTVLGREREVFLAALRVTLMAALPEEEGPTLDRERFWAVPVTGEGSASVDARALGTGAVQALEAGSPATLVDQLGGVPLVDGPMLVANRGGRPTLGPVNYRSLTEFLQLYARQVTEGAKALQTGALIIPEPVPPPSSALAEPAPAALPTGRRPRKRRSRRRYR